MWSQIKNANQVICNSWEQFDSYKLIQEDSKEVVDSTPSLTYMDGHKTDIEEWKVIAMSITEEIAQARFQLKHFEDNAQEETSNYLNLMVTILNMLVLLHC